MIIYSTLVHDAAYHIFQPFSFLAYDDNPHSREKTVYTTIQYHRYSAHFVLVVSVFFKYFAVSAVGSMAYPILCSRFANRFLVADYFPSKSHFHACGQHVPSLTMVVGVS